MNDQGKARTGMDGPTGIGRLVAGFFATPVSRSLTGLGLLLIVGAMIEPRTVSPTVLLAMLPFAAILAVASIGQHLVIQQRGFDLSVAGNMSASAVLVTNLGLGDGGGVLAGAILATLAFGAFAGAVNGFFVNRLSVTPLVTTIGTNAVLLGVTYWYSNGVPLSAHPWLAAMAGSRSFGVPNVAILALLIAAVTVFTLNKTRIGRRFIAVGVNPDAARAMAINVDRYQLATYAVAGVFFAAAAILMAGVLTTPTLLSGTPYMLTTVAAVVVGGNPLNGDRASLPDTIVGALFLTFLGQLVVSMGFAPSIQNITQAIIILLGVAVPAALRGLSR